MEEWQQVEATAQAGFEKERLRQEAQANIHKGGKGGFFSSPKSQESAPIPEKPTPEQQACMELVEMARQGGQDINMYLGQTRVLDAGSHISELNSVLADYVGSAGHFTPIVKSSCLTLNLPALHNIEVIDTPGINDPIVSRSRITQQFMGQCDVIFFLSNCGQFLDQSDVRLLAQNIPSRGIDDICLIGSLFDSVLLDDGHKYGSLERAAGAIVEKLNKRAEDDFAHICRQIESRGEQAYMATALKKALPPIFISAMAFNIARHWDNQNESEEKILTSLQRTFPSDTLDQPTMLELANLEIIHSQVEQVRQRKDEILKGKTTKLLERFEPAFKDDMRKIRTRLLKEKEALESGKTKELTSRLSASMARVEKGRKSVEQIFERHISRIKNTLSTLTSQLKNDAASVHKVATRTGTETRNEAYQHDKGSGFLWWRDLCDCRYETRHRKITVTYSFATVHDSIDRVENFILESEKRLKKFIGEAVDLGKLSEDLLAAARNMVDFSDDAFDPDDILAPVESAISRIKIPEIDLNCRGCLEAISKAFNTKEVRDADIGRLQQCVVVAVDKTVGMINSAVATNQEKLCAELSQTGAHFISGITTELEEQIKRLKESMENLEQTLKRYEQVLLVISEAN